MSRKITSLNPDHPRTQMKAAGRTAKDKLRILSNQQLTELITRSISTEELRKTVLGMTRAQRIAFIIRATEQQFAIAWNQQQEEAKASAP